MQGSKERTTCWTETGVSSPGATGGSSLWLATPAGLDVDELARDLKARDVLIEPGTPFFSTAREGESFYRIAYSSITSDRIPEGIQRIARVQATLAR